MGTTEADAMVLWLPCKVWVTYSTASWHKEQDLAPPSNKALAKASVDVESSKDMVCATGEEVIYLHYLPEKDGGNGAWRLQVPVL